MTGGGIGTMERDSTMRKLSVAVGPPLTFSERIRNAIQHMRKMNGTRKDLDNKNQKISNAKSESKKITAIVEPLTSDMAKSCDLENDSCEKQSSTDPAPHVTDSKYVTKTSVKGRFAVERAEKIHHISKTDHKISSLSPLKSCLYPCHSQSKSDARNGILGKAKRHIRFAPDTHHSHSDSSVDNHVLVSIGLTHSATDYDRTADCASLESLTTVSMNMIRQELNDFKRSMPIHEDSHRFTLFYSNVDNVPPSQSYLHDYEPSYSYPPPYHASYPSISSYTDDEHHSAYDHDDDDTRALPSLPSSSFRPLRSLHSLVA